MSNVICFGEILWDLLPSGKVAGGAPMNVAYQLNQLGVSAGMVSRVGDDELGVDILSFLGEKGVPTQLVQRDAQHPTGIVKVTLSPQGQPSYEIVQDVAWDYIGPETAALDVISQANAFVFGSLVARNSVSFDGLLACIGAARVKVFDVNLRKPFFSRELLDRLLHLADVVKMNDEELEIIAGWHGFAGSQEEKAAQVKTAFELQLLIVTKGADGAICLHEGGLSSHPGYRVQVQDTIGSGDAFLAGYLSRYLAGDAPEACLDFACRIGAFVATQRGGTPVVTQEDIKRIGG